jgi:hypothetical protein
MRRLDPRIHPLRKMMDRMTPVITLSLKHPVDKLEARTF